MSKQHSTLSKGRNFTIESFDIVAVCGNEVECCVRQCRTLLWQCCWCGRPGLALTSVHSHNPLQSPVSVV